MGVYTASPIDFISYYSKNADKADAKTAQNTQNWMNGMQNLVKGGVDAYKWQQRKNILDDKDAMQKQLDQLIAERDELVAKKQAGQQASAEQPAPKMSYIQAVMAGLNPALMNQNDVEAQ